MESLEQHQTPALIPLQVPWQLSQTVTGLEIAYEEERELVIIANAIVVQDINPTSNRFGKRIKLDFSTPVNFSFARHGDEVDGLEKWGLSKVHFSRVADYEERDFYAVWREEGPCPNPYAYREKSSPSFQAEGSCSDPYIKYVLSGEDVTVLVTAASLKWDFA